MLKKKRIPKREEGNERNKYGRDSKASHRKNVSIQSRKIQFFSVGIVV
jgi:hypothetical protein